MKNLLSLALCAILCLSFIACTEGETTLTDESTDTAVSTEAPSYEAGYLFAYQSTDIAVGSVATKALSALGEARNKIEQFGCANFDGMKETIYYYPSFQITTHVMNNEEIITSIYLEDDTVSTKEGASIGMTSESLTSLYGTPTQSTANQIVFEKGDMTLQMILDGDTITSISYVLTVA